ncbi:PREDICTED: consortin [Chinchilla lanigera]|uniref:Consortin, connexin sorting protein n=1 Tax=Chinchilla lanigera TaxID=34839 RepID=A0A8C2VET4_CHILA|nr:PREDICTED: consortin [Chinchilla lanigera]
MDDSNPPTYNLQIESQDGCHPGDSAERRVTHLPSASDENENQLDGDGPELLTSSGGEMGKTEVLEQDSLNNNESCLSSCEVAASESSESTLCEHPKDGQDLSGKDKKILGKRSTRSKKGTVKKMPPDGSSLTQEKILSAAIYAVGDEETAEVNANDQPEAPKLALQSLFSLIRGEVEQLDSRALPLCLHQIAESYFQEEDYEKAMKFIQLERLYHEQLLANLSAIQEQWEAKWKTVQPHTVTPLRNSEKGFNGEDFEQLAKFCSTHQEPLLSKHKIEAIEKSLGRKCFTQLIVSEESKAKGATAKESESGTCLGVEPSVKSQHKGEPQESSAGHSQMDSQADSLSLSVTAGKDHTEEPLCHAEAAQELHTQSSETAGSSSGAECAENAFEDISRLQEAPTEDCPDVATLEAIADDPKVLPSSESMIEPLILPGCDRIPPVLISEGKFSQTQRKELHLPLQDASKAVPADQPENNALNELQQPDLTDSDGKSPQGQSDSETGSENVFCENNETSDLSTLRPEVYMAPEEKGDKEDRVSKEAEDYLNSLLEGCLKDAEDSLSYHDNQDDDSDLLQDLSPEEASYSLQESLPSDDSCLSLDDLAKRIEIAEVVPAEGLVSILKKRRDSVGDHPDQMQQKPSKRRVRFQEIDDNLDQDEIGGSSCILLILLCIATVFLSIGGTALYCTFGDMESPVCTDFADNMDFYYTKFLQGMAELKHWIYLS